MEQLIELPRVSRGGPDDAALMLRAASFDEAANTVEVVWTTGATVRRYSWRDGAIDEQLIVMPESVRLDRLNSGAPFLNSHDAYSLDSVIGAVVRGSAKIANGIGTATIQLSREEDDAAIVRKIKDGIISNVSVGYRIHAVEKIERDDGGIPLWKVTDWEPLEVSAVAVGADPKSQCRSNDADAKFPAILTSPDNNDAALAAARMRMRHAELEVIRGS